MNTFDIPHNFITVLAALVLALVMAAMPSASAFAEDANVGEITHVISAPQDATQLRRLLSNPELSTQQQRLLDYKMGHVYEELADASAPATPHGKGFIQSVNELLGVTTGRDDARAQG